MRIANGVLILLVTAAALGQARESITVSLVEVPVTVIDGSGNPVRGLKASNFELTDQGKQQPITSFDVIDFASPDQQSVSPMNPAARRNFLLLFDLSFSQPRSLARAQEAARKFLTDNIKPRDLVAVGTLDVDRGYKLLTAFTTDRQLLTSAIADPKQFKGTDPLQIANVTQMFEVSTTPSGAAGNGPGASNRQAADEEVAGAARAAARGNEPFNRGRVEKEVNMLGDLAKSLRAIKGRKQLILLSEGFDPKYIQGRDARSSEETALENEAAVHGQVWNVDSDSRYGTSSSLVLLDRMVQYFRGSDVVLNALDIQGVRVQNDVQTGSRVASAGGLDVLSRPTGGEVFRNANNLQTDFSRMIRQQEVVYVLGFRASSSTPGKFHDLKVKLLNASGRPSYRTGYYESGGESLGERALSTAEIIMNDIPQEGVRLAALAAAFPSTGENAQVPVILEVNGSDIMKNATGPTANAEIFVYAFDQNGVVRDRLNQKMSLDLKKVGDKLRAGGIKYYGTLSLPPGSYAIKTLVRADERKGFARTDLTVTGKSDFAALPPIFMEEQPRWLMVKGASHDRTNAGYPFEIGGQSFVPSAGVTLKGGESRKFAVFVSNASPEELSVETTPPSKVVSQVKSGAGTTIVMQLDDLRNRPSLDVVVRKRGVSMPLKTTVPIAMQ